MKKLLLIFIMFVGTLNLFAFTQTTGDGTPGWGG